MRKCILSVFTLICILSYGQQNSPTTDSGVIINGVKWATRNVDNPGTFAANPESKGKFYQWNNKEAFETTNFSILDRSPIDSNSSISWEKANDPCPSGWRVPTEVELQKLVDAGSTWTLVGRVGCFFGAAPNRIFIPSNDGDWIDTDHWGAERYFHYGLYWSNIRNVSSKSETPMLYFDEDSAKIRRLDSRLTLGIRCVSDITTTSSQTSSPSQPATANTQTSTPSPPSTAYTPVTSFFSDFNNNVFDINFWSKDLGRNNVNDIRVENGVMKIEQNSTDVKTHLISKEVIFNNSIEIERDVLFHHQFNGTYNGGRIFFGNRMTLQFNNDKAVQIEYLWVDYDKRYGTYLMFGDFTKNITFSSNATEIQMNESVIFDKWFKEKLVINRSGTVKYYINNILAGEGNVGSILQNANSIALRFDPYGWWIGHYQHFDNFSISGN